MLLKEPEGRRIEEAIALSGECRISSGNYLETSMIALARSGNDGVRDFDLLIARFRIEIVSFSESQARVARTAFDRYGRGRHPAQLNFGDCMSYALAKETGEELLFKGTDFAQTDIAVAPY